MTRSSQVRLSRAAASVLAVAVLLVALAAVGYLICGLNWNGVSPLP